jgi:hypothetical protein
LNLSELKSTVDFTIEQLHDYENPEEINVLITLDESSMGARASSGIRFVGMGFDWEHGQLRIEPTKKLVSKGNALTNIKNVARFEFGGQPYWGCPKCLQKIAKDDSYCRYCGQKLK